MCVRRPAAHDRRSRSKPMTLPSAAARTSRITSSRLLSMQFISFSGAGRAECFILGPGRADPPGRADTFRTQRSTPSCPFPTPLPPSRPAAPPFRARRLADLAGFRVRPDITVAVRSRRSGHPRAAARDPLSRDGLRTATVRVRAGRRHHARGHAVRRAGPPLSRPAPRRLALAWTRRAPARHDQGSLHARLHRVRVRAWYARRRATPPRARQPKRPPR